MKVILSTFGPLHLIKSAEFISKYVDIKVIQGWIPTWWNKWLLIVFNKILGYKLSETIKKRIPSCLKNRNIGIGLPEFISNFSRIFLKTTKSDLSSAKLYGWLSKKYIKDAEIFHVRSGSGMGGAIEKAKKCGMKIIVDQSIAHPVFMRLKLKSEYDKHHIKFTLGDNDPFWKGVLADCKKADILLVNSDFVKYTFIQEGFDPQKIKVVYLGVRADFHSLKNNYILSNRIKLLFTGNFSIRKGGEYLLKAMSILKNSEINCELTIVGGVSDFKDKIMNYKNIRYIGMIPQSLLKDYLKESDIYIFPSLCEGCAQSGMEALSSGLPVIATFESGLPIIDGHNGLIIKSKNENDIVKAIVRLINDNALRKKIGHNAVEDMKQYTWENYASNVVKLYSEIL